MRGGRRYWRYYADASPAVEAASAGPGEDTGSLRREADLLEERLKAVKARIRDLESGQKKDNG